MKNYKKGEILYSIESTDQGGAVITRHEVTNTAETEKEITVLEQGVDVCKKVQIQLLETDINGVNVYLPESNFLTLEEVKENISTYLNRKKLW